ncbi:MAG: hypothetical protein ACJ748_15880 [Flavisolibacter sp.]|jgi:hypothetical protein
MTLKEFKKLPEWEQVDIIYEEGTYIGKRKAGALDILLYQVDSFYVELYYREYRRHILKINYFNSTTFLDPYLEQMNLKYLV